MSSKEERPQEKSQGGDDRQTAVTATYFDLERHERVQKVKNRGVWTDLGARFGGLEVRLRQFAAKAVVDRQDAMKAQVMRERGIRDEEDLTTSDWLAINRAAVTMAITGLRGNLAVNGSQIGTAREKGFRIEKIDGREVVMLSGEEEAEDVRSFFSPSLERSPTLLDALVFASRELRKVDDEQVDRLGKGFVLGRHVKLDWSD